MRENAVYDSNIPPLENRLKLSVENLAKVDAALCAILDIDDVELARLRGRIEQNGYQLRAFVHPNYRSVSGEKASRIIEGGAKKHAQQALIRSNTVPVIFFLEQSPATLAEIDYDGEGVYRVLTRTGLGEISTCSNDLAQSFSHAIKLNGRGDDSHFLYQLLFDGLRIKRLIIGGLYREACMVDAREAAKDLGIEVVHSRFEMGVNGRNQRGDSMC